MLRVCCHFVDEPLVALRHLIVQIPNLKAESHDLHHNLGHDPDAAHQLLLQGE